VVVVKGQADLMEVVLAAHAVGESPRFCDGGQQQGDQDPDDGDHNQQFDKCKRLALGTGSSHGKRLLSG
jgi:hypothetical protein